MTIAEIVIIAVGAFAVLGSIVSVVWAFSNRPTYTYCDDTFQRKDLHAQEYNTLIEKIEELKDAIDAIKQS